MTDTIASVAPEKTWLGHPRGLYMLFFAEMWERFSYYGMKALLIFYLTKHFLFSDQRASLIYGAYTSLVYVTPVLGGYIADKYLGQRKAVLFGGVLIAIGHVLLGVEGTGQGEATLNIFWLALAFIIMGTGFLKANISTMVGQLYPRADARRDPAYTIFYMGINLGGFLGPVICGILGETLGWNWGFGAAAAGMIAGILVFVVFKPSLNGKGEAPDPAWLVRRRFGLTQETLIYIGSLAVIALSWWLVQSAVLVGWILVATSIVVTLYIVYEMAFGMNVVFRDRMIAVLFLVALQPIFWALFEQAGASINLYTDRFVDRSFLGVVVPASVFQSINSTYIILLAPLFATLWIRLARHGREPSTPAKFGLAIIQQGLGFLALVLGAWAAGTGNPTPVIFIFLFYLLCTTGELCLSPVGLSAMSKLSPARMASLVMGTWFLATAGGQYLAGMISAATGAEAGEAAVSSAGRVLDIYWLIAWVGIGIGVVVLMVSPFFKRLMHLDSLGDADDELAGRAVIGEPAAAGVDLGGERR